jgi:DNA-binding Lrp family transcriptional regulator
MLVERKLIAALQPGLELVPRPFVRLGERVGMSEEEVLGRIAGWLDEGLIKRFGVVVRHHELGYRANAMVVFDLPDAEVDRIGRATRRRNPASPCAIAARAACRSGPTTFIAWCMAVRAKRRSR